MKHIWSILCQKSLVDSDTNQISLLDCLEEISLAVDKANLVESEKKKIDFTFQLASLWLVENKKENLDIKIEFADPDGEVLNSVERSFKMKDDFLRFRSRVVFSNLIITKNGRYAVKVSNKVKGKYKLVSEIPFDVKFIYKVNI